MAEMTVQDLRDYVRSYLDTDEEDLPDTLLDVWRDQAITRIVRAGSDWKFLEATFSLTTTAEVGSYAFDSISDSLDEIISIVDDDDFQLEPFPHELAERAYANTTTTSTHAERWSVFADTLYLWPTPTDAVALSLRGRRKLEAPADAGASPDLPDEFHPLIGEFMLACAYEQQDDDTMSRQKLERFEFHLQELRPRFTRRASAGVATIGGAKFRVPEWPKGRLRYDWE